MELMAYTLFAQVLYNDMFLKFNSLFFLKFFYAILKLRALIGGFDVFNDFVSSQVVQVVLEE
jgi:hypothetical protein